MSLSSGSRLGPYEIVGSLGAGGMGEVYRARDSKLNRDVAIKILPDAFAQDAERLARFTREAQTLAALNHPNIAHIHGLEESAPSIRAIVMELVEGQDLAERLVRGPIPLDEALPIARQIAEALEAAHEQGIVHRDLKPANIKVRPDGTVKVLDFGLAKAMDPAGESGAHLANSPTLTAHATQMGVILGTAAYMSPEQAKGRSVDKRSDMWAFGCVLFEMLTGRRAFPGDDLSETLAAVIKSDPDWTALPADTPAPVRRLLRRCLARDRKSRLADASNARIELDDAQHSPDTERVPAHRGVSRRERQAWAAAVGLLAFVAAAALAWVLRPTTASAPEMRLQIATPSTMAPLEFALSPDGRHIVFVGSGPGPSRLWLRALDTLDAQPMPGTDGARYPFWSADSRSIGFFASSKLHRIEIAGGSSQVLASAPFGRGGTWNADGTILFASSTSSPLVRVTASGGEPLVVTRLEAPRQSGHRLPQFLPDGRHFLFYVAGVPDAAGVYLGSLDGGDPKRLTAADTAGAYLAPDRLLFVRQGTLVAQPLDIANSVLTGEASLVAEAVGADVFSAGFSAASDGRVAYRGGVDERRALTWFDRSGKAVGLAGEPDAGGLVDPELSPDGRRVAFQRTVQNNPDLWLMDLVRGGAVRLTFDAAIDAFPIWSPDGLKVAFDSTRQGPYNLYLTSSGGAGAEELLLETPNIKCPQDWSRDGRFLLYYEIDPKTGRDLWALPMTGTERKPQVVVSTPFDERHGQFSPDGRFVAYVTDETGRFEIVVQSFPEAGGKWPVSTGGGVQPRWRADGRELYFLAPDGTMLAAPVQGKGAMLEIATPVPLFATRLLGSESSFKSQYMVSRDGRFLMLQPTGDAGPSPITVLLNWKPPPAR